MNLLDLVFPKRCVGCGAIGQYICPRCTAAIKPIGASSTICPVCEKPAIDGATHPRCQSRSDLDGLTSFFHYQGVMRQAIKALKYRYVSDLVSVWENIIPRSAYRQLDYLLHEYNFGFVLVPVPLSNSRKRWRGFNQSELLGKLVADNLKVGLKTKILTRVRQALPQVEMKDREERLKNMSRTFSASPQVRPYPYVFLFDDVFTTGATLRSAAKVLKRAGARIVWGVTMAR